MYLAGTNRVLVVRERNDLGLALDVENSRILSSGY